MRAVSQLTRMWHGGASGLPDRGGFQMEGESWVVDSQDKAKAFCQFVMEQAREETPRIYQIKYGNRSGKQANALHLMFREVANALNDAGFGQPHPFNTDIQIPYTEESVKTLFFQPIIKAMFDKTSTRKLDTKELSEASNYMLNAVAENSGVVIDFPHALRNI